MPVHNAVGRTTRDYLKAETAQDHDRLDQRLGALVMGDAADYGRFLEIQYLARLGIEHRLLASGQLGAPPLQTSLIAEDLIFLRRKIPVQAPEFELPADHDPLGVCWVLAGSSLGNRAILARLAKRNDQLPVAFLSDEGMTGYWHKLRPLLERGHAVQHDQALLRAAQATFAHFNAVATDCPTFEPA